MNSTEYKLLSQSIANLYKMTEKQFIAVNSNLDKINGRVNKHDEAINAALQERSENRQLQKTYFKEVETIKVKVKELEEETSTHVINCPVNPQLRVIQDQLLTQAGIKKYLATMFMIGVALGGLALSILRLIIS